MVRIPSIERAAPAQQPSVGRQQSPQIDPNPGIQNIQTLTKLASTGADLAFKYQKDAEDTTVKDLANKYKSSLYGTGLPDEQGQTVNKFLNAPKEGQDFTKNYADYLGYKEELKKQIMGLENVSGSVAQRLQSEIADIDFYADRSVNVEYFKANNKRIETVYETDLSNMLQIDLANAVAVYDPKDPQTLDELQATLVKIGQTAKDYNMKIGFKADDPVLKQKVLEVTGAAADLAINDALNVRDTKKAQALWDEYNSIIPIKKADATKKKIADVIIENEINDYVEKYLPMREDLGVEEIKKSVPEEIRMETEKRYIAKKTQLNEQKNRISGQIENKLKNLIMKRNDEGRRFSTVQEFEKDPEVSPFIETLNATDRQSLRNMLGARPKIGDAIRYEKMMDMYRTGQLQKLTYEQLEKEGTPLNPSQWGRIERYWGNDKQGLNQQVRVRVLKDVKDAVIVKLPRDQFGNLTPQGRYLWSEYIEPYLMQEMDTFPRDYKNYNDYNNDVNKLKKDALQKLQEGRDEIPEQFRVMSRPTAERIYPLTPDATPVASPPVSSTTGVTTGTIKEKLKERYKKPE